MPGNLSLQAQRIADWFREDLPRRMFFNAGRLLGASGVAAAISLFVTALTARTLGPEKYGVLALVLVYQVTISTLVTFNAWQAIIKYGSETLQANDRSGLRQLILFGFSLDIVSAFTGTLLAVGLSGLIIGLMGWDESIRNLLVLYSFLTLFSFKGTSIGVLRLFDRFDLLSYSVVLSAIVRLIGVTWCFVTEQDLLGFVLVYLITGIIGQLYQLFAALWVLKRKSLGIFPSRPLYDVRKRFPGLLDYVWTTNLSSTIRMISRESDELIIAGLTTPADLGLYKIAKQFSRALPLLTNPLYQSIYPELARLWAADNAKTFRSIIIRSTILVGSIAFVGWVFFISIGEPIH